MLFDLKGKRRRFVQATYLGLAVLMGVGLVAFGIGSSVNGGLFDAFKGGGGSNKADEAIQKRIDAAERTLQTNPRNTAALASLTRAHYQMATSTADSQTSDFTAKSLPELQKTAAPRSQNYIVLVLYATLAGQTRKADLAGKQAIALAPKSQKKQAKQAVQQAKAAAATQGQGGQPAPAGTAPQREARSQNPKPGTNPPSNASR